MGIMTSQFEEDLKQNLPNTKEKFYGLENFGNTCYINSILQALYFCIPFRKKLLLYMKDITNVNETTSEEKERYMLYNLSKLFASIYSKEKITGSISPNSFLDRLRDINVVFRSNMQQDAHEFWNYLVNNLAEAVRKKQSTKSNLRYLKTFDDTRGKTFVNDLFEGILSNQIKCLTCENKTLREETFLDISVEIAGSATVLDCLKNFSNSEFLHKSEKFFCDFCGCLQEAKKEIFFNKLPKVLVLHLKRFKYNDEVQNYTKLSNRVEYPLTFEISDKIDPVIKYELFAFVIHLGKSPSFGHYVTIAKCDEHWFLFNDDEVRFVPKNSLNSFFGNDDPKKSSNCAYILFYKRAN